MQRWHGEKLILFHPGGVYCSLEEWDCSDLGRKVGRRCGYCNKVKAALKRVGVPGGPGEWGLWGSGNPAAPIPRAPPEPLVHGGRVFTSVAHGVVPMVQNEGCPTCNKACLVTIDFTMVLP